MAVRLIIRNEGSGLRANIPVRMSYGKSFLVQPGSRVRLDAIDPGFTGKYVGKASALGRIEKDLEKMNRLQYLLYAENEKSLLVVLQAVDGGGKDGTIRHVLSAMNPQGTYVRGFKTPSAE